MTVSPEQLAAFADGQLPPDEFARVARAVASDPALAAQVEAHRALRVRLSAHFAPILDEPVPDRLRPPSEDRGATVIDLASARSSPGTARAAAGIRPWVMRGMAVGGAMAAALALVIVAGPWTPLLPDDGLSPVQLAALDSQPSGAGAAGAPAVLLSFVDREQRPCRVFEAGQQAGIACHDGAGWERVWSGPASRAQGGEMRQANSAAGSAFAVAQDMAVRTLDAEQEQQAIARNWRRDSL
jgi:hypothetical protein